MKRFLIVLLCIILICGYSIASTQVSVNYSDGIYHIVVPKNKAQRNFKIYSSDVLVTNKEVHDMSGAELTVNAGFFDPNNGKTISYVVSGGQTVEEPMFNENIFSNPVLRKNLSKILNRTELRIVECGNKYHYEIESHNTPVSFGCSIKESVQGGPLILPDLRLEEEFFINIENGKIIRESCSVLHKVARTILGIKDGDLHILVITDENPMDMYEVQAFCKKLGFERAMGLDGGSSTSMDYKDKYHVISLKGDGAGRKLKSFITIYK